MTEATIIRTQVKPKLAFVGTGWIGYNRMKALLEKGMCTATGICDTTAENVERAKATATAAKIFDTYDELVASRPDGIVIATPNALHYSQCMEALSNGIAVFCQKPLARTADECRDIINAAGSAGKLLGIDMSYRFTDGMKKIKQQVQEKQLGEIFAADLVFHNAYGPDKKWFYNPTLSGGGCVIDLGIHLVDLALWVMDFPEVKNIDAKLYADGQRITDTAEKSEDFAQVQMETASGTTIRLTCSWNLSAGRDAEIKAAFYGTKASAVFENNGGSFYDFHASICHGTSEKIISSPPDDWGGRALISWAKALQKSSAFDEQVSNYLYVAQLIDKIYGRIPQA